MVTRPGCLRIDGTCTATGEGLCPQCKRIQRDWADLGRVRRRSCGAQHCIPGSDRKRRRYQVGRVVRDEQRATIDAKRDLLGRLWLAGESDEQISKATGYKPSSIQGIARIVGLHASDRGGRRS